jgi:hypothetical protein
LFWHSGPDDELFEAAARGGLREHGEIREQAVRLLGDDRAKPMVHGFYFDLLRIRSAELDRPELLTPELQLLMRRETEAFIDHVTFEGPGDFESLLLAPGTWVNAELASFYGVSGVTGEDFVPVELDPSQRAGILTQSSFLTTHAHERYSSPFDRGWTILEALLCEELQPPPDQVDVDLMEVDPNATTRERYEAATSPAECSGCHHRPQQIGYAFEHFDETGRYRELENERPIDATGELTLTDAAGRFDGAVELARRIAQSNDAKRCFVGKWLEHAYKRPEGTADACTRSELEEAFSSGNIRELLRALARSDAFLYRPVVPEGQ